jgi:tRNA U34 5-carboxymethylaminomethyl modifying enzyme MnmG/GidA
VANLRIKQDTVVAINHKGSKWHIKTVTGQDFAGKATVITTGTFLQGRSHLGGYVQKSGRNNEIAAEGLVKNLKELGFKFGIRRAEAAPAVKLRKPEQKIHDVVLQPESLEQQEWYLKGKEMDFAEDVQQEIVNSIKGLEGAEITRPGYSVTYNYLKGGQLGEVLESKDYPSLFFAGQVAGSNNYEEAAAGGLLAGTNAARAIVSREKRRKKNV